MRKKNNQTSLLGATRPGSEGDIHGHLETLWMTAMHRSLLVLFGKGTRASDIWMYRYGTNEGYFGPGGTEGHTIGRERGVGG